MKVSIRQALASELFEISKSLASPPLYWHRLGADRIWIYDNGQAPWVKQDNDGRWLYSVPTHEKAGMTMTKEDAFSRVEKILQNKEDINNAQT